MNQVETFISNQRAAGLSDEQIKQMLAANGWTPAQIQTAFPVKRKLKRNLVVGVVFIIFLIFVTGMTVRAFFSQGKQEPKSVNTLVTIPTVTPTPALLPAVAYIKYSKEELSRHGSERSGQLMLFDFSSKQSFAPELPNKHTDDFGKILSSWSPSGKKLFILGLRELSLPQPLYLYDSEAKKLSYIFDTNTIPELKGDYSSFSMFSTWMDDQRLLYSKSASVDITGKVGKVVTPKMLVQSNGRLKVNQPIELGKSKQSVTLDGKPLPDLKGIVMGMTNKYIVSIETPEKKNPILDPDFQKRLENAKNEEEIKKIIDQEYKPSGDSTVYLYLLSNPKQVTTIPWQGNSWSIVIAEPLYTKNSLIVHEVDSNYMASKNRFSMINLDTPNSRKVITETGLLNTNEYITGEQSINITQDDQWLVLILNPDTPDDSGLTGKIVAWNLDSGEQLVICESGCASLRVYNRNKLRYR